MVINLMEAGILLGFAPETLAMRVIFRRWGNGRPPVSGDGRRAGVSTARIQQRKYCLWELEQGIEFRVLPKEGFELETLPVKGLKGRGLRGMFRRALRCAGEFAALARDHPSIPSRLHRRIGRLCFRAAARCRAADAHPLRDYGGRISGRVLPIEYLARWVDRVFTAYREVHAYFPRAGWSKPAIRFAGRNCLRLKATGGFLSWSLAAARARAESILPFVEALKQLTDLEPALAVIHQTGAADLAAIKKAYAAAALRGGD